MIGTEKVLGPLKKGLKMKIHSIHDVDIRGKYVLLRTDFNVQIQDGKLLDTFRIDQSMTTINSLSERGARVVICSHMGRPKGVMDKNLSLAPVADYMKIPFVDDCLERDFLSGMKNGDVVLMENLRFYVGEEKNDMDFARKLANGFDLFVNDAFAVSHRAAASTVGITNLLPSYAGDLLLAEVANISAVMENPTRPLLAIVGGAKVSGKIGVLQSLCKLANRVIVGGALGTTFLYALGYKIGNSLYEPDQKDVALEVLEFAKQNNCEILLPVDKGVGSEFKSISARQNRPISEIRDNDVIMDDGNGTTARNIAAVDLAKTVIWNGTFGMAEWGDTWGYATYNLAREIAKQTQSGNLVSVIGGGETVAALDAIGVRDDMTYVSTGGGAFLEFIEKGTLPALEPLIVA